MHVPSRIRLLAALLPFLALVGFVATPAPAASLASSGLTLTVGAAPYFSSGAVGGVDDACGCGVANDYSTVILASLYVHATSTSSPITGYDVAPVYPDGPGSATHYTSSPNPLMWEPSNYDGALGCGSCGQDGWQVTVTDEAGQTVTKTEHYYFRLIRWNNGNVDQVDGGTTGTWAFSKGWTTSTCACADGGSQTKTATAGAYGSYLTNVTVSGEHLGLMVATGPTRGRADVYLDGKFATTIDTYAPSNTNRFYAWDSQALTKGQHTVKVVNDATYGRPNLYINGMGELHGFQCAAPYPNC